MSQASDSITGEVALVVGAGEGIGRAVALTLAARGARVVVSGVDEAAVAAVVGEITCGGGVARHVAGEASDSRHLAASMTKAREAFGKLTLMVVISPDPIEIATISAAVSLHVPAPIPLLGVTLAGAQAAAALPGTSPPGRASATNPRMALMTLPTLADEDLAEAAQVCTTLLDLRS
jgi:NAD(P)-dependent dehydrogenase (short-subunit alcohol dehydrogenase family)